MLRAVRKTSNPGATSQSEDALTGFEARDGLRVSVAQTQVGAVADGSEIRLGVAKFP